MKRTVRRGTALAVVAVTALAGISPSAAAENLAVNPSFEDCAGCLSNTGALPDGWVGYGPGPGAGTNIHWTTDAAHTGGAAVRIDDRRFFATGLASMSVAVTPGQLYTASVWVKRAPLADTTTTPHLYLQFRRRHGAIAQDYVAPTPVTDQWTQVAITGAAPVDAKTVRVVIYASVANIGSFYVDDVDLARHV